MNNMNLKNVVIYHGNCADGFGAAWVVRKLLLDNGIKEEDIIFIPGVYNKPAPIDLCRGAVVTIVDFSYPHAVMDQIAEVSWGCPTWIDHHKTAIEDMVNAKRDFDGIVSLEHSGAYLAWEYFFGLDNMPSLIRHIDDRDRWEFKLPGTREIQANLFSYPCDFKIWDELMGLTDDQLQYTFSIGGEAIERKHFKDIHELLELSKQYRWHMNATHRVLVANLPYTMASDAGHILAKEEGCDFAAIWYRQTDGKDYVSLRSVGEFDVSAIAKLYGGGGHKNAAGMVVDNVFDIFQEP